MPEATRGDTVRVEYTGRLKDGTVFDSSEGRDPLEFTLGEEQVIPGFEEAVLGLSPGQTATATLAPEDAYGDRRDDLVFRVERGEMPEELDPEVGDRLEVQGREGSFPATVVEVDEAAVLLDANHPLAGRTLVFDLQLVQVL